MLGPFVQRLAIIGGEAADFAGTKDPLAGPKTQGRCLRAEGAPKQASRAIVRNYLKLTEACHTKAKRKNKMGITGKTSTKGLKGAYASGNLAKKISVICILEFENKYYIFYYKPF